MLYKLATCLGTLALILGTQTAAQNRVLLTAAANGNTSTVIELIQAGADVDARDAAGGTALMQAAQWGHTETVKVLLDAGADPNKKAKNSMSALIAASMKKHVEIVRLLLDSGVKVDITDEPGRRTPLMIAADLGQKEIVNLLLAAGAKVNIKDRSGTTALMCASRRNDVALLETLLRAGADVNKKNKSGWTALSEAKRCGQRQIALLLEKAGAKPVPFAVAGPYELHPIPDDLPKDPDVGPRPIRMPRPSYPKSVIRKKVQGTVELKVLIDERGKVTVLKVLCSIPELNKYAIENVQNDWLFQPAKKNGNPVPVVADVVVTFNLY